MVLQDFNKEEDVLDMPDKKSIISRMPETIREMLSRNSDIMHRDICPDDLFSNTLEVVKQFEQAFIITEFHERLKVTNGTPRQVHHTEIMDTPTFSPPQIPSVQTGDIPSMSEF